jgi:acyl-CoA synthetase (AMP-forming)/AMP-acid ligase II
MANGLEQKGVMLSHRNVISQILQICAFESPSRKPQQAHQVSLGLLPQSHIYGLTVISHSSAYRGDRVIVLPRFTLSTFLETVERYAITSLFLVRQANFLKLPVEEKLTSDLDATTRFRPSLSQC